MGENPDLPLPTLAQLFDHFLKVCKTPQGKKITLVWIAAHSGGISIDTLESIKQGRITNPSLDTIVAICAALRVPPLCLIPRIWHIDFELPPDMEGFAAFPRRSQFHDLGMDEDASNS